MDSNKVEAKHYERAINERIEGYQREALYDSPVLSRAAINSLEELKERARELAEQENDHVLAHAGK